MSNRYTIRQTQAGHYIVSQNGLTIRERRFQTRAQAEKFRGQVKAGRFEITGPSHYLTAKER